MFSCTRASTPPPPLLLCLETCPPPAPAFPAPPARPHTHPTQGWPYHITFLLPSGVTAAERVFVTFRPPLHRLLAQLSVSTELLLFTSALPVYAEPGLSFLTAHYGARFRHQLYRSSTVAFKACQAFPYHKDLRTLLGERCVYHRVGACVGFQAMVMWGVRIGLAGDARRPPPASQVGEPVSALRLRPARGGSGGTGLKWAGFRP